MRVRLVPPEELIWSKLYVVQGSRCDWPDIVNLLFATGLTLDWSRLIGRCAGTGDEALLASVMLLFAGPHRAAPMPSPRMSGSAFNCPGPRSARRSCAGIG